MNYTSGMVLSVMINTLLENNPSDTNPAEISELHYYRALALGRDDEALTEYVTIHEPAPESAWGMLAGLRQ